MNNNLQKVFLSIFFISLITTANAQIVINEYSASNLSQFIDNFQKYEDWVELYNTSNTSVDLTGWYLSDKESNPTKWQIPAGTTIEPNGFLLFYCSGRDGLLNGELHTSFKLSQTKGTDFVVLTNPSESIIESTPLELTLVGQSRTKSMDGGSTWVIAEDPTPNSPNITPTFTSHTATPSMNIEAGFFNGAITVSIQNNEPNSVLHYTTDGTLPTVFSPVYSTPINVNTTTVIKARAYSNDASILPGKLDFNTYFINENFSLDVYSVAADDVQNLANGQGDLIPVGSIEYFRDGVRLEATYGSLNRHGQDSWALNHRSIDWITRDEMGYTNAINQPIFDFTERDSHQRLMFRASGDDNYPALQGNDPDQDGPHTGSCHIRDEYVQTLSKEGNMKLDVRGVQRVILFLDGDYWGLYGLRERPVDHDYTKEYYGQGKYDLQYLSTWGSTEIEYGGQQALNDWGVLRDFILDNDMSSDANYQMVKDNMQVKSLIDYMIANLATVAKDWLNYNTGWWRGLDPEGSHKKWGYILWDMDATFGYYINYTGVPNETPSAEPCDINEISDYMDQFFGNWGPGDPGKHEKIFLKLQQENEEFRQLYYSRYADLINTVYSCENMNETFDRMIGVIEPEMPRQIQRWGGSLQEWQDNVEIMRDFINARCSQLHDGVTNCFNLTGPFDITLEIEPADVGEIEFNTLNSIDAFPWTGQYYGNMENLIEAKSKDNNYTFDHWETANGSVIFPDMLTDSATITLTGSDTLTAVFVNTTVAVDDIEEINEFVVYPSITNDLVSIKFGLDNSADLTFEIYNLLGEKVASLLELSQFYTAGDYNHELNLSDYNIADGMYLLTISSGSNSRITSKITLTK